MLKQRASGVLCHLTSLPSPFGIGDLGPEAYRFVDFLARSGQKYWQVLPINPTEVGLYNSPYSTCSAFAFNTLLISPEGLADDGYILRKDLGEFGLPDGDVDYKAVTRNKARMLSLAWSCYRDRRVKLRAFEDFCQEQRFWLDDYALFAVLKKKYQQASWTEWPLEYRDRAPHAIADFEAKNTDALNEVKFAQFLFYRQWMHLQEYCSEKNAALIGDIPIYVNHDSVDVWVHPFNFKLDARKQPSVVAGVPPDYFSEEGQRWGNPVYDWGSLQANGFAWWVKRLKSNLALFDAVRIDHFRAFAQCWEIPASEKTAKGGAWRDVPGSALFSVLKKEFPNMPIIAEDLGIITQDVDDLKAEFGLPGMRVMMFAFHNDYLKSRDLPANYVPLSVAYTGTHDNNTTRGWYEKDITPVEKKNMNKYFTRDIPLEDIHWEMVRQVFLSISNLAIVPVQDLLGLGAEARMNRPSTVGGNWKWRLPPGSLTKSISDRLKRITIKSGR